MRKINFIIGNRSHFARIFSILENLKNQEDVKIKIILFDSASININGNLVNRFLNIKNFSFVTLYSYIAGNNLLTMAKSTSNAISELSTEFYKDKPDIVFVVADRYETIAAAIAARYLNICLVHLQGGENSGSIDNSVRYAVTKLANYHFVSNKDCLNNLIACNEKEDSIFITGCPTLDLFKYIHEVCIFDIFNNYKGDYEKSFKLTEKYIIVVLHPDTIEYELNKKYFLILFQIIKDLNIKTIWIKPNVDAGSNFILQQIRNRILNENIENIHFFQHFNIINYLALLKNAICIVGNSSVGIRESSYIGLPAVNIGNRQKSRKKLKNVIDCNYEKEEIKSSIQKQLQINRYEPSCYYGDGNSGEKIACLLQNIKIDYRK